MTDRPPGFTGEAAVEPPEVSGRAALLKFLDRETAIARATGGRLAVLILELRRVDRLQALLKGPAPATTMALVVDRLSKALRPDDRIAPISDEQVCLVLPRLSHPSQAVLAAVKLLRALDRPIAHEGGSAVLRPCVGIANLPEHGFDPAGLLMAADVSRHIAATHEEGYHVFQGEDAVETEVYRGLDLDLERALRANELELNYLPVMDLSSGRPVGAEALVRWRHPQAGDISPANIIGIADRTGLAGQLAFWVLNAALREAAQWRGRAVREPRFSVNLSAKTITDRELPSVVEQSVKTWNLPPERLTLEIPESSAISEAERATAVLTRLKAVGVRISLDDFGSGFSSLSELRKLPIDEIKIDRPYVSGMLGDRGDRALVRTAIDLAHHFEIAAVAEGVETPGVLDELQRLGCDYAQGFLIARPLSERAFRDWWSSHTAVT
jgi:EAL domain-containing protein (putative c-di-GMP-specific phosphodiesterase class I)/GGDEF domain-containing protein